MNVRDYINAFSEVHNTLLDIEVKGENALKMAHAISIQREALVKFNEELTKESKAGPVPVEESDESLKTEKKPAKRTGKKSTSKRASAKKKVDIEKKD